MTPGFVQKAEIGALHHRPPSVQEYIKIFNGYRHAKLCRIMQKQTHDKIHKLENQINRVESILLVSTGALISGMAYVIFR